MSVIDPNRFNLASFDLSHVISTKKRNHEKKYDLEEHNFNSFRKNLVRIGKNWEEFETKEKRLEKNCLMNSKTIEEFEPVLQENELQFESRFESGNLSMVSKVSESEYNLLLQNDINTKGNTQWFYFRVKNTEKTRKVKFNIMNFVKNESLYTKGMQVCVYSLKNFEKTGEGWYRGCENLSYFCNGIPRLGTSKCYYTLSFEFEFEFPNDTLFFSYSFPYTYSDLTSLLDKYEQDPEISKFYLRKRLCYSLCGNILYFLTITKPGTLEEIRKKPVIIITARVHPGETPSSHILEGFLQFLTGSSQIAVQLRHKFIFKIIPMLNPDGVINGNYRCSLLGVDLNRRWKKPSVSMHPEIFYAKKLIESINSKYKIAMIIDLHGHSINKNIFMYGCNLPKSPHVCKVFPYFLSTQSNFFSFFDSRFTMQKDKEKTLRVTLFKELKVRNTFTVEASFCGGNFGKYEGLQYSSADFRLFGEEFAKSLLNFDEIFEINSNLNEIRTCFMRKIEESSEENEEKHDTQGKIIENRKINVKECFFNFFSSEELIQSGEIENDFGSDSEPSEDNSSEYLILTKIKERKKNELKKITNVSTSAKILPSSFCKLCGKKDLPNHKCISTVQPIIKIKPFAKISIRSKLAKEKINFPSSKNKSTQTPGPFLNEKPKITSEKIIYDKPKIENNSTLASLSEKLIVGIGRYIKNNEDSSIFSLNKSAERIPEIKNHQVRMPFNGNHILGIIEGVPYQLKSFEAKKKY